MKTLGARIRVEIRCDDPSKSGQKSVWSCLGVAVTRAKRVEAGSRE